MTQLPIVVQIAIQIVILFVTIFGLWYKIDRDTNARINQVSENFANKLIEAMRSGDEKRSRIYTRLDEVKESFKKETDAFHTKVMDSYVPLKICTLVHSNSEKTLSDFKVSVEKNFDDLKKTMSNMEIKMDKLSERNNHE